MKNVGKGAGCAVLGCAGLLVLLLMSLLWAAQWFREHLPEELLAEQPELEEIPASEAYAEVDSLEQFDRQDGGDQFQLSFGFLDYHGREQRVSCSLSKRDYQREVASFGFFQGEMDRELERQIRDAFLQEAQARGLLRYVQFETYGGTGYRWTSEIPGGLDSEEADRIERAIEDFDEWLDQDLDRKRDELMDRYLRERGFRLEKDGISVDYARVVDRATSPLRECYEALRQAGEGDSERRLMGLFLAFFQELRYELPPDVEAGRQTLGFRVPTAVLARGAGDCDSKSAAFCAMWRNLPRRSILILLPEHALVGVEGKPGPDEAYVRLGNRYYILCEVAGPGKIPPGGERISGSFEYVMIEPVR